MKTIPESPFAVDFSIHDVMPETLAPVGDLLEQLAERGWGQVRLLVVPGKQWRERDIDTLKRWQLAGHELAGHGWSHQVDTRQLPGLGARLHSLFFSRDAAEHLALDADGILQLLMRCHSWFEKQDLIPPTYYVAPAWAMGAIGRDRLHATPFRYFEYFSGVYDAGVRCLVRIPLVGFEADDSLRALSLRLWNRLNQHLAGRKSALRVAIHPFDAQLRLARDLAVCLERFRRSPPASRFPWVSQTASVPSGVEVDED